MKSLEYNYKDDIRGPGDGCRVCTGRLEIDSDGDLVCYYCNTVEKEHFNYCNWKLYKLEQQRKQEIEMQPYAKQKKLSLLTKILKFIGFK